MNREKLSEALENINSTYIEAAGNYRKKQTSKMNFFKWSSLAACFTALMITSVLFIQNVIRADDAYWSEPMKEHAILEQRKICIINDPTYADYISLRVIDPTYVGEKLSETEVKSFWRNFLLNEDTDFELLRAEIYIIKDVSPDIAVCIRYLDEGDALTTTHYYTYVNTNYKPKNFGDFCRTFALDFSAKNGVTLSYPSEEGTIYQYCDIDGNILTRSLISLSDAKTRSVAVWNGDPALENEKEILKNCSAQAFFSGEISPGGTFSCRIYDNGYLYIQINKTISYLFEISDVKTDSVFRTIDEHNTERTVHETVTAESAAIPK